MTDSQDYRKYLESKFDDIDTYFGDIKSTLRDINSHLAKLNSKVAEHEKYIVYANGVIDKRKQESDDLKERIGKIENCIEQTNNDMLEYRFFKKYPKVAIGVLVACIAVVLLTFFSTKSDIKGLKTEVDMINTPMVLRGGPLHTPIIDSLNRN